VTQYMSILVRKDGEEFGVLFLGDTNYTFQSVFPSDLFSYQKLHETYLEALEYLESIWKRFTIPQKENAFYIEMVRQREHLTTAEDYGIC
jgi:hypothetical protein